MIRVHVVVDGNLSPPRGKSGAFRRVPEDGRGFHGLVAHGLVEKLPDAAIIFQPHTGVDLVGPIGMMAGNTFFLAYGLVPKSGFRVARAEQPFSAVLLISPGRANRGCFPSFVHHFPYVLDGHGNLFPVVYPIAFFVGIHERGYCLGKSYIPRHRWTPSQGREQEG